MIFINTVLICVSLFSIQNAVAEPPKLRILAPPFVCPKDNDDVIEKSDYTIVTLQTDPGVDVEFHWTVRWHPLPAPTQRFTLELWRNVRELEEKLNGMQIEPNVFIINNTELLNGINYTFNVTAITVKGKEATEKVFHIDNIKGDPTLLIQGAPRSNMFSIVLIGEQMVYSDVDFTIEAQVTTCYRTNDYYFVWTVNSGEDNVTVSDVKGSQLMIRANTLMPGLSYDVLCQVFKYSNGEFITQESVTFRVLHRTPTINFNVDVLLITIDTPFSLYTDINKLDYLNAGLTIAWECSFGSEPVDTFYRTDGEGTLSFPSGLPDVGEYTISLTVNVFGKSVADQAVRVITVEGPLPTIQIPHMSRVLNEESVVTLRANISDMRPGCSVTWYFRSKQCLISEYSSSTEICSDIEHGTPISAPVNFYSLEENFLSELTDYTNETGWRLVEANLEANFGRARVVAECTCEMENCTGEGVVYADISFTVNSKPPLGYVMVMPEIGTAMETIYRLSTLAVTDSNRPLKYSFYADLNNNDTMLLGSYLEHLAVETLLPFIGDYTIVRLEVCDSFGACTTGPPTLVPVSPGQARTVDALLDDALAHVWRCELMLLRRLAMGAIVTYTNAGQTDALSRFTSSLLNVLGDIEEQCIERNYDLYHEFKTWLQTAGLDTTKLL